GVGGCGLGREGAGSGVWGRGEGEEERVALRVDLLPARRAERLAQDAALAAEHLGVPVAELLQEGGRALDVREQEGDGAAWKRAHGAEYECEPPRGGNGEQTLPARPLMGRRMNRLAAETSPYLLQHA